MLETIFYGWRLCATGFCFAVFGLGGVVLGFIFFPLLNLIVTRRERRIALARNTVKLAFRFFIGLMHHLAVLRYDVSGRERLNRTGLLVLANHPSLIDTVFLMALTDHADCILKADLQRNFFTRGAASAAGYIFNDQGMALIEACAGSLERGSNLIVFPEGTRSPADGSMVLKRGAANIALRAGRDITPVVIRCEPRTLGKGDKWYLIPARMPRFQIWVEEDIAISRFSNESVSDAVAARRLTDFLHDYFTEEVQRHV